MQTAPIGILGASGYSGMEATRILAFHPRVELRVVSSDRWKGDLVEQRLAICATHSAAARLVYTAQEEAERLAQECAAVLLCTPVEASLALAPRLLAQGVKVVDLSGAFRLQDPAWFQAAYGLSHPAPALLQEAVYSMPELSQTTRHAARSARLIANPGCFPTAAALPLVPLFEAGLLEAESVIVDAASGVTGAGRKATEELSFSEVEGDFKAYRVLRHQHTPEIAQALGRAAGRRVALTFTPHLLPLRRGILATAYVRVKPGVDAAVLRGALLHKYASEPFISVADHADAVALKHVVGTNRCQMGVAVGGSFDEGRAVIVSTIDNLVKGAAGQAVQNLNLLMGWPESEGLSALRGQHP